MTGVLGAVQIILIMMSYDYLDVGDAGAIISCNPILVGIIGWIFLSERLTLIDMIACVFAVAGVISLSHPSLALTGANGKLDTKLLFGVATGLGGALAIAVTGTLRRLLCLNQVNRNVSLIYIHFIGALACSVICTLMQKWRLPKTTRDGIYLVSSGIFGYLNNLMIMIALQHEKAYHVFVVNSSSTAMLYVLQFLCLSIAPDLYSVIGSLCVVIGVLLIARPKEAYSEE